METDWCCVLTTLLAKAEETTLMADGILAEQETAEHNPPGIAWIKTHVGCVYQTVWVADDDKEISNESFRRDFGKSDFDHICADEYRRM
jgi:hypothetical protein